MYQDHEVIPDASVADLDEFKQLPEETQRLAERVIGSHAYRAYAVWTVGGYHPKHSIREYDYNPDENEI